MKLKLIRKLFYPLFKAVAVFQGIVFYAHLVIVDGAHGVVQHGGNLLGVVYAKADEGKDPELSCEPSGRRIDTAFFLQEGVEAVREIRIHGKECSVEGFVEFLPGFFRAAGDGEFLQELVGLAVLEEVTEMIVFRADDGNLGTEALKKVHNVVSLHFIGLGEFAVAAFKGSLGAG